MTPKEIHGKNITEILHLYYGYVKHIDFLLNNDKI